MDNEKYMKRCYGLAVSAGKKGFDTFGALLRKALTPSAPCLFMTGRSWRKRKTQRTGKRASSAMPNSTWSINARTGIRIMS